MRVVILAATAGLVGWLVAPWVAMWRHGTLDQQTVRAWRSEPHKET